MAPAHTKAINVPAPSGPDRLVRARIYRDFIGPTKTMLTKFREFFREMSASADRGGPMRRLLPDAESAVSAREGSGPRAQAAAIFIHRIKPRPFPTGRRAS